MKTPDFNQINFMYVDSSKNLSRSPSKGASNVLANISSPLRNDSKFMVKGETAIKQTGKGTVMDTYMSFAPRREQDTKAYKGLKGSTTQKQIKKTPRNINALLGLEIVNSPRHDEMNARNASEMQI